MREIKVGDEWVDKRRRETERELGKRGYIGMTARGMSRIRWNKGRIKGKNRKYGPFSSLLLLDSPDAR